MNLASYQAASVFVDFKHQLFFILHVEVFLIFPPAPDCHFPNFYYPVSASCHEQIPNSWDAIFGVEFAKLDSGIFVDFELPQKSVAVLLLHPLYNVLIVDAPYKHFASVAARHNEAAMVECQYFELFVPHTGSKIIWSEFYREQWHSFISITLSALAVPRTFSYFKLISF